MTVERVEDPARLERFLNREWQWAGFAIGDLEPELASKCEWLMAEGSLMLKFSGLEPRLMCHYGDGSGLEALLEESREAEAWVNVRVAYAESFSRHYDFAGVGRMRRMYLEAASGAFGEGRAEPLGPGDREEVEDLLKQGEWVLFLPEMLASGHFYGVREGGRLAAIAGAHLASARFDIAALGSVFTHPAARGKGYGRACASHALASFARAGIRRVVLNVAEENSGARRIYEGLGFATLCVYFDGKAKLID